VKHFFSKPYLEQKEGESKKLPSPQTKIIASLVFLLEPVAVFYLVSGAGLAWYTTLLISLFPPGLMFGLALATVPSIEYVHEIEKLKQEYEGDI
jgi:hypothetical protein